MILWWQHHGAWWKTFSGTENRNRLAMMLRELQYLCRNTVQSDLFMYLFIHSTFHFGLISRGEWESPRSIPSGPWWPRRVHSRLWKTIWCFSKPPSSVRRHDNTKEKGSVKVKAALVPCWVRILVPSLMPDHPFNGRFERDSDNRWGYDVKSSVVDSN